MSTDTTTEAAIVAQLNTLIPQMIHERRMSALWAADYDRDRQLAMPLLRELGRAAPVLRELGRAAPGDGWETAAGSIRIAVRRGELDWQRAYEELRAALGVGLPRLQWAKGREKEFALNALAHALLVPVPRKPDSAPYLDLREAREEPDAIKRARLEGRFDTLRLVRDALTSDAEGEVIDAEEAVEEIASAWGGWPDGDEEAADGVTA